MEQESSTTGSAKGREHGETGSRQFGHVPVLLQQAIEFLAVQRGGTIIDSTIGLAGHSWEIAKRLGAAGRLIGFDKDPAALQRARERLTSPPPELAADWPQIELVHASFAEVARHVATASADGLLADLGVSSMQLENAERGFSFQADGPLDMRMNTQSGLTAAQLAGVVSAAARPMNQAERRIHPATRTFQALRILVNRELDDLRELLSTSAAPQVLKKGGRLVVISFHSLEDRIVKDALREGTSGGIYRLLTKKPVTGEEEEIDRNPRARSAKMRAAERI